MKRKKSERSSQLWIVSVHFQFQVITQISNKKFIHSTQRFVHTDSTQKNIISSREIPIPEYHYNHGEMNETHNNNTIWKWKREKIHQVNDRIRILQVPDSCAIFAAECGEIESNIKYIEIGERTHDGGNSSLLTSVSYQTQFHSPFNH